MKKGLSPLDERSLLLSLEDLTESLGIEIRREAMSDEEVATSPGGFCRIRKKEVLILNTRATVRDRLEMICRVLRRFDLSTIYLKPVIRDLLERDKEL